MSYKRAEKVLPTELIKEIQKYVSGDCIYIPIKHRKRMIWGTKSGYRNELDKRNQTIFKLHQEGLSIFELSDQFFLSEKSIYRILNKKNPFL